MFPAISGVTGDGQMVYGLVTDVRQIWPIVKGGVEQIIQTNNEPFLVEDVYTSIIEGRAAMYIVHTKEGKYAGFSVLTPHQFPYTKQPDLNLWLGYTTEPTTGHYGIEISKVVQQSAGFQRLVFATPQDGWPERYAQKIHTWYEVN